MKSLALTALLMSQDASAVISAKQNPKTATRRVEKKKEVFEEPKNINYTVEGNRMIVEGTRRDHTMADGSFKHPFLNAPHGVEHISYPDEKSFSIKLTPQKKSKRSRGFRDHKVTVDDRTVLEKVQ